MLKQALASLAFTVISCAALAQHPPDASLARADSRAVAETRALLVSASDAMDRQQAELEAGIRDATARAKWREQDRVKFFQKLFGSEPAADYEKQIAMLTSELGRMQQAAQRGDIKGEEAERRFVARMRELTGQLKAVTERQSAHVLQQLRAVKPSQAR